MALILLCGQPCSGKTRVGSLLSERLRQLNEPSVVVIDEPSLNLSRQDYKDMVVEKNLRGILRSAVDRSVNKDTFVIVDSLNNIKGYRYELWCLARAAATKYCVVFCHVTETRAKEWNQLRMERGEDGYSTGIMDDLLCRFETPIGHNRWDSPLFECRPGDDSEEEVEKVVADVTAYVTGSTQGVPSGRGSRNLQPTIATQNAAMSESNRLHIMDKAVQEVMKAVVEAQSEGQGGTVVNLGAQIPVIRMQRPLGMPELRRHKLTFLKMAGHSSLMGPGPPSDPISAKRMFAEFLNRQLIEGG